MKNKTVLLMVVANLTVLVLLAIFASHLMISPGKPIEAHSELATNCFACHTPFSGASPTKCISCHAVVEIGLKTTKGISIADEKKSVAFHQNLIEEDCVACHSDHKGVQAFRPINQFSHELLQESIGVECGSCHSLPGDALHLRVDSNCSACHGTERWTPATFDHADYFRFDRPHDTDCVSCHVDNIYDEYTCYACHAHSRSNIREEHFEEGISDYENCVNCHRSGDEDEAKDIWRSRQREDGAGAPRSEVDDSDPDDSSHGDDD